MATKFLNANKSMKIVENHCILLLSTNIQILCSKELDRCQPVLNDPSYNCFLQQIICSKGINNLLQHRSLNNLFQVEWWPYTKFARNGVNPVPWWPLNGKKVFIGLGIWDKIFESKEVTLLACVFSWPVVFVLFQLSW